MCERVSLSKSMVISRERFFSCLCSLRSHFMHKSLFVRVHVVTLRHNEYVQPCHVTQASLYFLCVSPIRLSRFFIQHHFKMNTEKKIYKQHQKQFTISQLKVNIVNFQANITPLPKFKTTVVILFFIMVTVVDFGVHTDHYSSFSRQTNILHTHHLAHNLQCLLNQRLHQWVNGDFS